MTRHPARTPTPPIRREILTTDPVNWVHGGRESFSGECRRSGPGLVAQCRMPAVPAR